MTAVYSLTAAVSNRRPSCSRVELVLVQALPEGLVLHLAAAVVLVGGLAGALRRSLVVLLLLSDTLL